MVIRKIENETEKQQIAESILHELPEWFGLPESTAAYVENSKKYSFWAAFSDQTAIGFIVLKKTSSHAAEIYVMGVRKEWHRHGVGRGLYKQLAAYAERQGYAWLQVKTVAEGCYPEYDRTRRFYESMGFLELEVFPTLWDVWNPCSVMVLSLPHTVDIKAM